MNDRDIKLARLRSEAYRIRNLYEEEKERIKQPLRELKDKMYDEVYRAIRDYQSDLEQWERELHEREARVERLEREAMKEE